MVLKQIALIVVLGLAASAQDKAPVAPVESGPNLPMQRIGADDLLALQVYDAPEFTRSVRVSSTGTIRLPMLKTPLTVEGLYPNDVEVLLAEALQREKLFIDPFVTVNVAEYHSRPINVIGAVRAPTIFQAIGTVTLLDALARAGGLSETAGADIIVTRMNGSPAMVSVQRIAVKPLLEGIEPELNLKLTGGEEIRVPEAAKFIVEGNVIKPGLYAVLDPVSNNTVTTAIAQAGGLSQYADHTAFIFRTDDQGVKHTIPIPLWDILYRKQPDIILQARDILQVPDSPRRRITQTTIQTLSGFGAQAGAGVIITRR